jgi:hypothetical protein
VAGLPVVSGGYVRQELGNRNKENLARYDAAPALVFLLWSEKARHLEGEELFCRCTEKRNGHFGGVRVYVETEMQFHSSGDDVAPEFESKDRDGSLLMLPRVRNLVKIVYHQSWKMDCPVAGRLSTHRGK